MEDFFVSRVSHQGRAFEFHPRRKMHYRHDEACRCGVVEDQALNICVFANSNQEALALIGEEVAMLWDEYAMEDDEKLSPTAQELKAHLLQAVRPAGV